KRRRSGGGKQGRGGGAVVVRLEPPVLEFRESQLCIPASAVVEVRNEGRREDRGQTNRSPCGTSSAGVQSDCRSLSDEDDLLSEPPESPARGAADAPGGCDEDEVEDEGGVERRAWRSGSWTG
ncbi:unnamed protein product, partial [Scytosiphon promiscuus]